MIFNVNHWSVVGADVPIMLALLEISAILAIYCLVKTKKFFSSLDNRTVSSLSWSFTVQCLIQSVSLQYFKQRCARGLPIWHRGADPRDWGVANFDSGEAVGCCEAAKQRPGFIPDSKCPKQESTSQHQQVPIPSILCIFLHFLPTYTQKTD